MKKMKKLMLTVLIIGFISLNFTTVETNAVVSNFYKDTYAVYYATGLQPSINFNMNMEHLKKEDSVLISASAYNSQGYSYTASYPSSTNRSKILQSLLYIEADSLQYEILFQYYNNQGNYYAFVIEKSEGTFRITIRRNLQVLYASQYYPVYQKYIMIDMITFITHFNNNLIEGWYYFKMYLDNGQASYMGYQYFQYQEGSISLTTTQIMASYTPPTTNIVFCSRLIRYGSLSYATNLYPTHFQDLLFENSMDISFKNFVKSFENLPYLTFLSVSLTSTPKLIPFVHNITYVNGTDDEGNPVIANFTIDLSYNFTLFSAEWDERRFYYDDTFINVNDWGNWGTMNWLRDGLATVINSLISFLILGFYLIIIGLNYLLWIPFAYLIIIVNNYAIYAIVICFVAAGFGIAIFFAWVWFYLLDPIIKFIGNVFSLAWDWFWKNVIAPIGRWLDDFINWLKNEGLITLIMVYLMIVAFGITCVIFVLSLGLIDFITVWSAITVLLWQINSVIFTFNTLFFGNIVVLIQYGGIYILLVGLIYVKYIYNKARGNIQRANRLQSMINVYKLPLVLTIRLIQYVIGFIQGGTPTDGAEN